jgi:hypothetical protein
MFALSLLLIVPTSCAKSTDADGDEQSANPSTSGASCVGACGQKSPDESCWCDPECAALGDCCADLNSVCSFPDEPGKPDNPTGGSGGTGNAGGSGGSSSGGSSSGGSSSGGSGGGFGGSSFGGTGSGGVPNTGGPSCAGACGGPAAGEVCWCEPGCVQYGDCCPDYAQLCGGAPAPTGGGCTPQQCGTETPATQNGVECYCDPACKQYGDCCANITAVCGF